MKNRDKHFLWILLGIYIIVCGSGCGTLIPKLVDNSNNYATEPTRINKKQPTWVTGGVKEWLKEDKAEVQIPGRSNGNQGKSRNGKTRQENPVPEIQKASVKEPEQLNENQGLTQTVVDQQENLNIPTQKANAKESEQSNENQEQNHTGVDRQENQNTATQKAETQDPEQSNEKQGQNQTAEVPQENQNTATQKAETQEPWQSNENQGQNQTPTKRPNPATQHTNGKIRAELGNQIYYFGEGESEKSDAEAYLKALSDITARISTEIYAKTESYLEDILRETNDDVYSKTAQEVKSRSSVTTQELKFHDRFWEKWVWRKKENFRCWVIASISQDQIDAARDRAISNDSQEKIDEVLFDRLKKDSSEAIKTVKGITDFSDPQNGRIYAEKYYLLTSITSDLKNLGTFTDTSSGISQALRNEYETVKIDINDTLGRYGDPNNRQNLIKKGYENQIEDLKIKLEKKTTEVETLYKVKSEIAEVRGMGYTYKFESQNTIVAFPSRPVEREFGSGRTRAFAANEMVKNRDYISYATVNGKNDFSRAERGLDRAAVSVTWNDAALYCNWLNRLYGYDVCYEVSDNGDLQYVKDRNGYRLPERDEIRTILREARSIIKESELTDIAIWSSDSDNDSPQLHKAYRLKPGTGNPANRLIEQSIDPSKSDWEIGFRVVRNAR